MCRSRHVRGQELQAGRRRTFLIWKEKRTPNFVLETTSKKTRREDACKKKESYALLQIPEYFLYDPTGDWLRPQPLQGFRWQGSRYEPIAPNPDGSLISAELGVRFILENGELAMFDVVTGERLRSAEEAREHEARRAEEEKRRADLAEERLRVLEEELTRLREAKARPSRRRKGD